MIFTHKPFLKWSVYAVVVTTLFIGSWYLGFLYDGFRLDHSYLSYLITAFFLASETYLGWLTYKTSVELRQANSLSEWLEKRIISNFKIIDSNLVVVAGKEHYIVPGGFLADHIKRLFKRSVHWQGNTRRFDQGVLLQNLQEKLFDRNSWGSHAAQMLLMFGLIGTILGIILTFWPFLSTTQVLDIAAIQENLSKVFSGVGAALYPSAFSAIFASLSMFNDRMLNTGTVELVDQITNISETYVVPTVEKKLYEEQN